MAPLRRRTATLAALARRHPKTAICAAMATFICLPVWLPLLLLSSPLLIASSLLFVGFMGLLGSLLRLPQGLLRWASRRSLGLHYAEIQGRPTVENVCSSDEGCQNWESRINEYLDDQLNAISLPRSESEEDVLPCSFFVQTDNYIGKQ